MVVNPVAEHVLGTVGAICWIVQLFPQIWKSWREKSTEGLSPWLVLIWGVAAGFLGIYIVVRNLNIPLILQSHVFGFLSIVSWGQCLYYGYKWSCIKAAMAVSAMLILIGGIEVATIFALKIAHEQGNSLPVKGFGILSTVLLALALVPQYWIIYRYREVVGISLLLVSLDMLGGIFSDLSLAFMDKFDVFAAVAYTVIIFLEGVVLLCALVLNPRARRRRAAEATSVLGPSTSSMTVAQTLTPLSKTRASSPSGPLAPDEGGHSHEITVADASENC